MIPKIPDNECPKCGKDLVETDGGMKVCTGCYAVFGAPQTAPSLQAPTVTQAPPQDVESLAKNVASQVARIRNEWLWREVNRPGVIIRGVDGGYYLENRQGDEAVRCDIESAMAKVREWLTPPK
jgi:uncharacterized Zn finger protein (UPF0148 family)